MSINSGGGEIGQSWIQATGLLPSDRHWTTILTMLPTLTMVKWRYHGLMLLINFRGVLDRLQVTAALL